MLVSAAAARWRTDAKKLRTGNGFVLRGKDKLSYGQLAVAAQGQPIPRSLKLKDRKQWIETYERLQRDVPLARGALDQQFRAILSGDTSRSSMMHRT